MKLAVSYMHGWCKLLALHRGTLLAQAIQKAQFHDCQEDRTSTGAKVLARGDRASHAYWSQRMW